MAEPFIAEVRIFAGNFAPRGWALCNGQLLPIAQNTALFSLVGTTYGGDGRVTLGLPNLEDRAVMHPGRGPGLTSRRLGESGGVTTVTLTAEQGGVHTHSAHGVDRDANVGDPTGNLLADTSEDFYEAPGTAVASAAETIVAAGGGGAHNNVQPYLAMYHIIALVGQYPSRG